MKEKNNKSFDINHLDEKKQKYQLLQQDLDVNLEKQTIVTKRIKIIKEFLQDLPNTAPEYAIINTQLEMDRIELDELINRAEDLKFHLKENQQ